MTEKKTPARPRPRGGCEPGVTLIELVIAITLIGLAIPTIMIPFSGLEDTKRPEYVVQGSFIAQKKMEQVSGKYRDEIDASCAALDNTTDGDFTINCATIDVASGDLTTDVGTDSFAKRVTLTVTHSLTGSMEFYSLFALDS